MPYVELVVAPSTMPRTRSECLTGPRPCPYTTCRHHLAAEARWPSSSEVKTRELGPGDETCALDVADRGPHTLEEISTHLGLTRERIRQIEEEALAKLRRALGRVARQRGGELDDFRPSESPGDAP